MNLSEKKRGVDSVCGVGEIRVLWPGTRAGGCPEKCFDWKHVKTQTRRNGRHHVSMHPTGQHATDTSSSVAHQHEDTTVATQRGQAAQASFGGGSGGRSDIRFTRSETGCTNSVISTEIVTGLTWAGMIESGKHSEKAGCP